VGEEAFFEIFLRNRRGGVGRSSAKVELHAAGLF
jgi:hypothetical protein